MSYQRSKKRLRMDAEEPRKLPGLDYPKNHVLRPYFKGEFPYIAVSSGPNRAARRAEVLELKRKARRKWRAEARRKAA